MVQLTVSLAPERVEALQKAAAKQGRSVDEVVDSALSEAGIGTLEFDRIVELAGRNSSLSEAEAMALALEEVRAHRAERYGIADGN